MGELVWTGAGTLGATDGWVVLSTAERAALLLPEPSTETLGPLAERAREALGGGGALFFRQLSDLVGGPRDDELVEAFRNDSYVTVRLARYF